jgi:hypothetical protein
MGCHNFMAFYSDLSLTKRLTLLSPCCPTRVTQKAVTTQRPCCLIWAQTAKLGDSVTCAFRKPVTGQPCSPDTSVFVLDNKIRKGPWSDFLALEILGFARA